MRSVPRWVLWFVAVTLSLANANPPLRRCLHPSAFIGRGTKQMAKVFDRAGAHIVEKAVIDGRKAWTVECLIQPALKRTIVYFGREKNLVEVGLHINSPIGIS